METMIIKTEKGDVYYTSINNQIDQIEHYHIRNRVLSGVLRGDTFNLFPDVTGGEWELLEEETEYCQNCGEQEAEKDGLCMQCIMEEYDDRGALNFAFRTDDKIRTCECIDYPCCGH